MLAPVRWQHDQRKYYWLHQDEIVGKIIKYKSMDKGVKDLPRFPRFIDIRSERDMWCLRKEYAYHVEKYVNARNIPYTCKKCKLHTIEYRSTYKVIGCEKKYDIDEDQLNLLWVVFKGKCGICNNDLIMPIAARGQPLNAMAIDHSHVTGNLRGYCAMGVIEV